jgi:hypothetical protein
MITCAWVAIASWISVTIVGISSVVVGPVTVAVYPYFFWFSWRYFAERPQSGVAMRGST